MRSITAVCRCLAAVVLLATWAIAAAEPGITDRSILIGRTTAVSGQLAGTIREHTEAIDAYFNWVNANGGVNGRRIVMKTLDDAFDAKRAGENARRLIDGDEVFALFMPRGTPHTEAVLKVAEPAGVPVIAPSTGAEIFHDPVRPLVFNVRAKYQDEVAAAVRHFAALAVTRIAIVSFGPTDSFGRDAVKGFDKAMAAAQLKPVLVALDRVEPNIAAAVAEIVKADPQAVIVAVSGTAPITLIKAMRARGITAQVLTLSNNSSTAFVADLGADSRNILITQVSPAADSPRTGLGKDFLKIAKPAGATPSYAAMEAFCAAKVLVEGLRRAGRGLTRKTFVDALNAMHRVDLGDMTIDFSPAHHSGSAYVEMTLVGANGRFIR